MAVDGECIGRRRGPAAGYHLFLQLQYVFVPVFPKDENVLLVRIGKGIRDAGLGVDDEGAVDGGAEPGDVGVPEQSAPLPDQRELVRVGLTRLNRALSDVSRPIRPASQPLSHPMPAIAINTGSQNS